MSKKIGIFTPYLDTLTGGEKYILTLASCLSDTYEVSLFWDMASENEASAFYQKIKERFGIDVSHILLSKNIFSSNVGRFRRLLETRKYYAIIFLSDGSIPSVLSRKLIIHFQYPVEWIKPDPKLKLKMSRARIICNSYFTKSFIDKKFGVNSTVLYPPVDVISYNADKKENTILHVGRFTQEKVGSDYKKQSVMVQVFKNMVKKGLKHWKFIIATTFLDQEKEHFEKFKKSASGLPIEFIINGKNSEIHELYKKAKIYWHATGFSEDLEKHPERAEHFGISTVEAMSAGAVPVVINAGGQKEIVTEGEDGFLWNTLPELESKTKQLIEDRELLKKIAKNAHNQAQVYSRERFCHEAHDLLA